MHHGKCINCGHRWAWPGAVARPVYCLHCGSRLRPCRARATVPLRTAPIGPAWATMRREYLRDVVTL